MHDPQNPNIEWNYHVAALVYIETAESEEAFVVDPSSLTKSILTVDEWLGHHSVLTKPKIIKYPAPRDCSLFEEKLLMFSSHNAFWEDHYDKNQSAEDRLDLATDLNRYFLKKLKKNNENTCE
ncbi:MAG: hypothetical protein H6731_01695 [Myxococcales bacterium]|nr:MAG: hypothetical protein H6731_01695 [Myxococcales bacterium]